MKTSFCEAVRRILLTYENLHKLEINLGIEFTKIDLLALKIDYLFSLCKLLKNRFQKMRSVAQC